MTLTLVPHRCFRSGLCRACAVLAILGACASAHAQSPNPFGWPRLPTDAEIESARSAFQSGLTGRILYIRIQKFHREGSFDGTPWPVVPLENDGVYMAYAVAVGGEAISVNGQAMGQSTRRELHRLTYLRYDKNKDEFYFGGVRLDPGAIFTPALTVINNAAEAYPLPTEAQLQARIVEMRKEQVLDTGNGHVTRWRMVDGWAPGSVASGGIPTWIVAVGGGAAVAAAAATLAAAAAVATRLRRNAKPGRQGENDDPDRTVGYVLQLSAKSVSVDPVTPASLQVKAWRVDAQGGYADAPEAVLSLRLANASGLEVLPASGRGSLTATISCLVSSMASGTTLTVTATANGKTVTEAVEVRPAAEDMTLEMDAERDTLPHAARPGLTRAYIIRNDKSSGQWHFGDLVVWFTEPGISGPVAPKFAPVFEKPIAEPQIAGLRIEGPTTSDNLTWHFKISLDPAAPIDEDWLARDGRVYVTVSCREAQAVA